MPVCCIVKCGARKNENQPQLSLHRFPKNEGLKKKWSEVIGEENINPRHKVWYLCSLHFEESCFNRTLDVMRLHDISVPTVFSAPDKKLHQRSYVLCETSNIKKSVVSAYKKLLVRAEIRDDGIGNCTPLEQVNILTCSSKNSILALNELTDNK